MRRGSEPNLASLVDSVPTDKLQIASGNLRPFLPRRESVRVNDSKTLGFKEFMTQDFVDFLLIALG